MYANEKIPQPVSKRKGNDSLITEVCEIMLCESDFSMKEFWDCEVPRMQRVHVSGPGAPAAYFNDSICLYLDTAALLRLIIFVYLRRS